jgi:hypothetical protein
VFEYDLVLFSQEHRQLPKDAKESYFSPFVMYLPSVEICKLFFSFDMLLQLVENIDLHVKCIKRISCLIQFPHSLAVCQLLHRHSVSQLEEPMGFYMFEVQLVGLRYLCLFDDDEPLKRAKNVLPQQLEIVKLSGPVHSVQCLLFVKSRLLDCLPFVHFYLSFPIFFLHYFLLGR